MTRLLSAWIGFALIATMPVVATAQQRIAPASQDYRLGPLDLIEVTVAGLPELTTRARLGEDGAVALPLVGSVRVAGLTANEAARLITAHYEGGGFARSPSVRIEIVEYQSRRVSVLGEVNQQGMVTLDRPYTVLEVLARAGGLKEGAADQVTLTRPVPGGTPERRTIDLRRMMAGSAPPLLLLPGDTLVVPRAPTVSVVGAVNRPGLYRLGSDMTVQQALATAGDVARIGTTSALRVRRRAGNGTISTVKVQLGDLLQADDTLVVRERVF